MRQYYYVIYLLLMLAPVSVSAASDILLHGVKIMNDQAARSVIKQRLSAAHQRELIATDRYHREVVRIIDAGGNDLAITLLQQGAAMVWDDGFAPHTNLSAMFNAEADARVAKRGIWKKRRILDATNDRITFNQIAIVQGVVYEATRRNGNIYINFDKDWREDFTLFIGKDRARKIEDSWLAALAGKTVRARGMVYGYYGPMMDLLNIDMLEIVE